MSTIRATSHHSATHSLTMWTALIVACEGYAVSTGRSSPLFGVYTLRVALLLLGFMCIIGMVVQACRWRFNKTPFTPAIVLGIGAWVAGRESTMHGIAAWNAAHPGLVPTSNYLFPYALYILAGICLLLAIRGLIAGLPLGWTANGYAQYFRLPLRHAKEIAAASGKTARATTPPNPPAASPTEKDATTHYEYPAERPRLTFADLFGNEDLKTALREAGQAWREDGKNGIVMFGPPGCGKTAFAEALAGELGIGFMKVTFGNLASRFINQSTEHLVTAFREARAQQPVMLFMDEIEAVLKSRDGNSSGYEEYERMVTAFLTEVVDARGTEILVVGATNYIDRLDAAAIREGRFDTKIEVPLPDADSRRGLLTSQVTKYRCTVDQGTLGRLTRRWAGFNVPRLLACAEGACRLARKEAERPNHIEDDEDTTTLALTFDHFYRALRKLQGRKAGAPEDAKALADLFFDDAQREQLQGLATQLVSVDDLERMGGSLPKGVIFYGPPGTGKTATAAAVARECGWSFITRTGRQLLESGAVDELAKEASDLRPAIVFIDEADDILGDRAMSPYKSATNELLVLIDGANGALRDVVWVAATNYPDSLDAAARRGGRFGQKIAFGPPSKKTALAIITDWITKKEAAAAVRIPGERAHWLEQVYAFLAKLTPSDVYQVLESANNAAITASLQGNAEPILTPARIEQAAKELKG